MDSGFHVHGFRIPLSKSGWISDSGFQLFLCTLFSKRNDFNNRKDNFFLATFLSSSVSMKYYKYNLYSIKSDKIHFFALPVKDVNTSVL